MSISDPASPPEAFDHNLQPFFVLHKALPQKPEQKEARPCKTRRKIDVSHSSPKSSEKSENGRLEEADDHHFEELRFNSFNVTWSKIESTIKDVLREINLNLFDEVSRWITESFVAIKATREEYVSEITRPYPLITDEICKQIPAALVLTMNTEIVDDFITFQELGVHLKSNSCHVAKLSSLDFTAKHGVGGCIRSLLRQLVVVASDTADISVLASWYCERQNFDKPVVVVIDDTEQCNGSILAEFIMMLSEWVIKIPIILILGISTTIGALRKLLPSGALQHLQPCKFTSVSPQERMNSIVEAVLVKTCSGFTVGYKVALFLRNYFLKHDGTITSFVKALKIACTKHFYMEQLSFLGDSLLEEDCESVLEEKCGSIPSKLLGYAFNLPSCEGQTNDERTGNQLLQGLHVLRKSCKCWSSVLMCLCEAGKLNKMQLLDIFCEAVDPALHKQRASGGGFIAQAIHKVRDLSVTSLGYMLQMWAKHTQEISEVHGKIRDLQSLLRSTDGGTILKPHLNNMHNRSMSRFCSALEKDAVDVNGKAALLMEGMVRDYLKPIEHIPFHEIVCFKQVEILKSALIGDPRRTIQVDLLQSRTYIQCGCCSKDGGAVSPTMHDTSIVYTLSQEHGDLINLHDWYQSFKAIILKSNTKSRHKTHQSPASKRASTATLPPDTTEAMVQARFCRAVTELQITGLLRMPSKRRPDYVQRVAFGI